ncbi:MAG: sulfotransferase domain-containing protein [Cyclobacteriaceae bacterium]
MNILDFFSQPSKEDIYLNKLLIDFKEIRNDDIFLVGYPKSGNTWIRFLIGNYISNGECNFINSHLYVPGLSEHIDVCNEMDQQRFMSTHFSYLSFKKFMRKYTRTGSGNVPKIIFIARDGRDVAVSYYYHLIKAKKIGSHVSFSEFINMFNSGDFNPFQNWNQYVLNWMDKGPKEFDFLLVEYSELLENPSKQLRRMLEFSGVRVNDKMLLTAVGASSFNNMKTMEKSQSKDHIRLKDTSSSLMFVRSGESGGWKNEFSDASLKKFEKVNKKGLVKLGFKLCSSHQ